MSSRSRSAGPTIDKCIAPATRPNGGVRSIPTSIRSRSRRRCGTNRTPRFGPSDRPEAAIPFRPRFDRALMASDRQIAANRRNAAHSTGPRSTAGKRRSRSNALQHGLTAETVVPTLEDADDYHTFEAAIAADYQPRSAVEHHLVARLASLLWRLRRASLIETGLFAIQGKILRQRRAEAAADAGHGKLGVFYRYLRQSQNGLPAPRFEEHLTQLEDSFVEPDDRSRQADVATAFLRLCHLNNGMIERLGRYETMLWRQATQILMLLEVGRRQVEAPLPGRGDQA